MDIPEQRTGRLQAQHLATAGHHTLGYAWPADPRVLTFAQPRRDGVRQAFADLGLAEPQVVTVPLTPDGMPRRYRPGGQPHQQSPASAPTTTRPPAPSALAPNDEA